MTHHYSQTPNHMGPGASFTQQATTGFLYGLGGRALANMYTQQALPPFGWSCDYCPASQNYTVYDPSGHAYVYPSMQWQPTPQNWANLINQYNSNQMTNQLYQGGIGTSTAGGVGFVSLGTTTGTTWVTGTNTSSTMAGGYSGRPHPQTKLKSEGIRAGEIIAWRCWRYDSDSRGPILRSAVVESVWDYDEPMKGNPADGYGVHAYRHAYGPADDSYSGPKATIMGRGNWVLGKVAMWGDVIEHKRGYRSEYGRVHSLTEFGPLVPTIDQYELTKRYVKRNG